VPAYKIASGDLKSTPLLTHVARMGKPMVISTGGALLEDVQRAYDTIMPLNERLVILQCTAGYPAAFEELDLRVIATYRERFAGAVIGFSSHDNGIAMPVAAYMLGRSRGGEALHAEPRDEGHRSLVLARASRSAQAGARPGTHPQGDG
jgi:N-acetylneuraminate synthase/sialic acid synthase